MATRFLDNLQADKTVESSAIDFSLEAFNDAQSRLKQVADWTKANVAYPFANAFYIQPRNAAANAINFASQLSIGTDCIKKTAPYDIPQAEFLSSTWLAQTVSGGLGSTAPYAFLGGVARTFMKTATASQILSAAAYDGLRDTHPGETRLGNMAYGASCFSLFHTMQPLTHGLAGMTLHTARAVIGFAVSPIAHLTGSLVSGADVTSQDLLRSAVTGSLMNVVIPKTHELISAPQSTFKSVDAPRETTSLPPETIQTLSIAPKEFGFLHTGNTHNMRGANHSYDWKTLCKLASRLNGYSREKMRFEVGVPNAKFDDYAGYLANGVRIYEPTMAVYGVKGHPETKVIMDTTDVRGFSRLKALKFLEQHGSEIDPTKYTGKARAKLEGYMKYAANGLRDHPYYDLLPLEMTVNLLDMAPNSRRIDKFVVLNHMHRLQPWLRKSVDKHTVVHGEAIPGSEPSRSEIRLNLPLDFEAARESFLHEFFHALQYARPKEFELFSKALKLESVNHYKKNLAIWNEGEAWAYMLGNRLCNKNSLVVNETLQTNPILSSFLGRCLSNEIKLVLAQERNIYHKGYEQLCANIEHKAYPIAEHSLFNTLELGSLATKTERETALQLLQYFGNGN